MVGISAIGVVIIAEINAIVNIDEATTGIKVTYTVPSGKIAIIRDFTYERISGTATADIEIVKGATTYRLRRLTGSTGGFVYWVLESGDSLRINVTTAGGVGANSNVFICGDVS